MSIPKDTLCPSKWGDSEIGTTRCRYPKGHSGKHATIDAPEGKGVTWTDAESDEYQDALQAQRRVLQGFDHTATPPHPALERTNATFDVLQTLRTQCETGGHLVESPQAPCVRCKAADEIGRLRAENAELREIAKRSLGVGDVLRREVERLRSIEYRAKLARDAHADKESEMALYDDATYILTGQPEGLYT